MPYAHLSDEAFKLLAFAQIGKRHRENEGGVFTAWGYVEQHSDPHPVSETMDFTLRKPKYIFRVGVTHHPDVKPERPGKVLWLIHKLFPSHSKGFVEVFGGSGTVLLSRPLKKGCIEIYNDFNSNLTNLFFCIKKRPLALIRELGFLPLNSRDGFQVLLKFFKKEELPSLRSGALSIGRPLRGRPTAGLEAPPAMSKQACREPSGNSRPIPPNRHGDQADPSRHIRRERP